MLSRARVVRELGVRTPGTYLAQHDDEHGERVFVVLETYAGIDARAIDRVEQTARALRDAPRHPHVVTVLSAERIGDGLSIVTDFVDGLPLEETFFRMSTGARLRAVVDVLAALSALHALGIVHRGSLVRSSFVERTGRTRVGFAYRGPLCVRKDGYAPEVLLGDEDAIDARSDVYGAGVLLWEAVTGRALFGADTPERVVEKQLSGRVEKALPSRSDRWASVLLPVVERALAVDPAKRFSTVAEMAAALRIAVRARLMMHDDVFEELWPAETTPKNTSGVQPAAEPIVATAQAQVQGAQEPFDLEPLEPLEPERGPAPPADAAVSVEPPVAPPPTIESPPSPVAPFEPVALPVSAPPVLARVGNPRVRTGRVALAFAASAGVLALAAVFAVARGRAHSATPPATAAEPLPPVVEPAVAPPPPVIVAPPASAEHTDPKPTPTQNPAHKAVKRPGKHVAYDPSTI